MYVTCNHLANKSTKTHARAPAQLRPRFRSITEGRNDVHMPEKGRIDLDQHFARLRIKSSFVHPRALPFDLSSGLCKSDFNELTHRVIFTRCQHIVAGRSMLQH